MKPHNIKTATLFLSSLLIVPVTTQAANITNGDFQTNDFTGWTQDVDGLGAPAPGFNDFSIVQPTAGNYAARIEADYWSTPGNPNTGTPLDATFFANTLYQSLDLSGLPGQNLTLSFDWTFSGQNQDPNLLDETFFVALGDGSGNYYDANGGLGFLLNRDTYGSGTFSTTLDSSFLNALGWTLEFQLGAGLDGYGSFARIDNVSLNAASASTNNVPEPTVLWLMGLGLIGLTQMQRKNKAS